MAESAHATAVMAPVAPVRPGDVLAGKYRVLHVIGAGGMGIVVAAEHVDLHQHVALKFLLPAFARNPEASARFLREARASVKIRSEHVCHVLDVGRLESGSPYMVMELLEGCDLAQLLQRDGPLPVSTAVDFILQASEAIAEAHALGIVHRDLKPGNLFLTYGPDGSPCIKVVDFGISKMREVDASGRAAELTATTAVMGSPHYMSPEQIRSTKTVDARSDIWALGVILFELLTGEPPFTAETISALVVMIATDPPARVRETRPEVPPELESVVLACLEKAPASRPQDVGELARRLSPFASPAGRISAERAQRVVARPAGGPFAPGVAPVATTTDAPWTSTGVRRRARSSVPLFVALAATAAAAIVATLVWMGAHRQPAVTRLARTPTIVVRPIAQPAAAPPPSIAPPERPEAAPPPRVVPLPRRPIQTAPSAAPTPTPGPTHDPLQDQR